MFLDNLSLQIISQDLSTIGVSPWRWESHHSIHWILKRPPLTWPSSLLDLKPLVLSLWPTQPTFLKFRNPFDKGKPSPWILGTIVYHHLTTSFKLFASILFFDQVNLKPMILGQFNIPKIPLIFSPFFANHVAPSHHDKWVFKVMDIMWPISQSHFHVSW